MVALRHVALRCRDVARSRRFYEEGLGLPFVGYRPGSDASMDLADGNVNLTLIRFDGPSREALEEGAEFIHLGFTVDDLAVVYRRFVALGAVIARDEVKERREHDASKVPAGSFKVLDPDGNVLDVSERPDEWRTAAPIGVAP